MQMNHPSRLPIVHQAEYGPQRPQPKLQRHHTARYYAHRVKESLSTRVSKFICTIFLFILFIAGLIAFILWLSLRPHRPRFYIEDFSILTLTQPNVPPAGSAVHFNVTVFNPNQKVDVHYNSISCNLYYNQGRSQEFMFGAPLQTEAFDQESKNSTIILKDLVGLKIGGQLWAAMQHDIMDGTLSLRLELNSAIKFEIFTRWDTKTHKMHATCNIVLGSDGVLLNNYRDKRCRVYFT